MFEIDIKRDFSAAHRLKGYKGNCASLHGHNWAVTVTVKSEKLDKIGIAVDFRKLKTELDAVLSKLDHSNLNDLDIICSPNPTSECLAKFIFDRLSAKINDKRVKVSRVRVAESKDTGASYFET
ncbi:MAG TPA: 6-carboxytetrahydropterin synthase QueD [Lentisphaeria bacterium]|nr:MAG: 6-carboxytetrahydropterin synthase QueD [Lentisphaerae bacterium GWF2_50_93]HCE45298.1 6-carboxytetrahydropterin synthase QueD [Lentisphaeria bacterium]